VTRENSAASAEPVTRVARAARRRGLQRPPTALRAPLIARDMAADVILRSVGVRRDLGSVEYHQALSRMSRRSRVAKPVMRVKMRSNLASFAAWSDGSGRP
jgi:hypothetical protein